MPQDRQNAAFNVASFGICLLPISVSLLLTDHLGTVRPTNYLSLALLSGFLFLFPDALAAFLRKRYHAAGYFTTLPLTIAAILLLAGVAFLSPPWLTKYLLLLVLPAVLWSLYRGTSGLLRASRNRETYLFFGGILFCTLLLYGLGYHNWLYTEALVQRKMHVDILFHSSIAESIHGIGWPATSLDGSPYLPYHWFSHFVLGGLAGVTGLSSLAFYHLFYPAIFVPLFLKFLLLGSRRVAAWLGQPAPGALALLLFLVCLYAIPFRIYRVAQPFSGESLLFSLLLVFTHLLLLLDLRKEAGEYRLSFPLVITSFCLCLLIAFTKISTGFVWIGTLGVLSFWKLRLRSFALLLPGFAALAFLTLLYVFPPGRETFALDLFLRLRNLLEALGGAAYLFFPLLVLLLYLLYFQPSLRPLRYWRRSATPVETVCVLLPCAWFFGLCGAVVTSSRTSDVMLFTITAMILAYPLLLILFQHLWARQPPYLRSILGVLMVVLFFTHLRVFFPIRKTQLLYSGRRNTTEQSLRAELFRELHRLRGTTANTAIYLPPGEEWFYDQTDSINIKSSLAVPALSGLPLIGGIPRATLLGERTNIYGLGSYLGEDGPRLPPANPAEARRRASALGYDRLLIFREENGRVKRETADLRQGK